MKHKKKDQTEEIEMWMAKSDGEINFNPDLPERVESFSTDNPMKRDSATMGSDKHASIASDTLTEKSYGDNCLHMSKSSNKIQLNI